MTTTKKVGRNLLKRLTNRCECIKMAMTNFRLIFDGKNAVKCKVNRNELFKRKFFADE